MNDLPSILIVDDEEDLGEILGDYLEDDFVCAVFSDPKQAVEALKNKTFNLVISDMHMPEITGFDIIEVSKKTQPDTPVILLTGNSRDDPIVKEAVSKGANGIITKPFQSPEDVLQYLKSFLK